MYVCQKRTLQPQIPWELFYLGEFFIPIEAFILLDSSVSPSFSSIWLLVFDT